MLRKNGWRVREEPQIRSRGESWKPDLLLHNDFEDAPCKARQTFVVDVAINGDRLTDPDEVHFQKVNKYQSIPEVVAYAKDWGCDNLQFGAVAFSWRGFCAPSSISTLKELGISKAQIETLSQIVVEQGVYIYRSSRESGYRLPDRHRRV